MHYIDPLITHHNISSPSDHLITKITAVRNICFVIINLWSRLGSGCRTINYFLLTCISPVTLVCENALWEYDFNILLLLGYTNDCLYLINFLNIRIRYEQCTRVVSSSRTTDSQHICTAQCPASSHDRCSPSQTCLYIPFPIVYFSFSVLIGNPIFYIQ